MASYVLVIAFVLNGLSVDEKYIIDRYGAYNLTVCYAFRERHRKEWTARGAVIIEIDCYLGIKV